MSFEDGVYLPPGRCPTEGCRGKTFAANRASATSVDWQRLRLQASMLAVAQWVHGGCTTFSWLFSHKTPASATGLC